MSDLDTGVLDVLDRHYPPTSRRPDWEDVLFRAEVRPRRPWGLAALVAAVVLGIAVPAFAFSVSVRSLLGFSRPVLGESRLMVSAPLNDGRVLRLWESPSDTGGACVFVTSDRADTDTRPARMGGGACSGRGGFEGLHGDLPLQAGMSMQARSRNWVPPTVSGWIDPSLGATRVELRSRVGVALKLALANNYFIGASPKLFRPSFDTLPYSVIAFDAAGREVARQKISSYAFYLRQKKDLDRTLIPYVRAHPGRHIM